MGKTFILWSCTIARRSRFRQIKIQILSEKRQSESDKRCYCWCRRKCYCFAWGNIWFGSIGGLISVFIGYILIKTLRTGGCALFMRTTRTSSAVSTLRGVRTTTTLTIRMGSPRILGTVCEASKFWFIVHKLGLDLVAKANTISVNQKEDVSLGSCRLAYLKYLAVLVERYDTALSDTGIWTLLAWSDDFSDLVRFHRCAVK